MNLNELLDLTERNTVNCSPVLVSKVKEIITDLYIEEGLQFSVFMGYRSPGLQYALWMQSRFPLDQINKYRFSKKLPCIDAKTASTKVTNVSFSWHCLGLAVDLVENGDPNSNKMKWSWSNLIDYKKIGSRASKHGLDWGGMWRSFKDYPHLEYTKGKNILQAKSIFESEGLHKVWEWI